MQSQKAIRFGFPLLALVLCILWISGCKGELLTPSCDGSTSPTYDSDVKAIIDATCMGSSCHSAGSNDGDFTSYAGLEPFINSGDFENSVLTKQNMPRGSTLTQEQINTIQCWVNDGYPEQ